MIELPTPGQLAAIDDQELQDLAAAWRTRALHGERDANGIAHALEVELRRRTRESQMQALGSEPIAEEPARPWWRFWQSKRAPSTLP